MTTPFETRLAEAINAAEKGSFVPEINGSCFEECTPDQTDDVLSAARLYLELAPGLERIRKANGDLELEKSLAAFAANLREG